MYTLLTFLLLVLYLLTAVPLEEADSVDWSDRDRQVDKLLNVKRNEDGGNANSRWKWDSAWQQKATEKENMPPLDSGAGSGSADQDIGGGVKIPNRLFRKPLVLRSSIAESFSKQKTE